MTTAVGVCAYDLYEINPFLSGDDCAEVLISSLLVKGLFLGTAHLACKKADKECKGLYKAIGLVGFGAAAWNVKEIADDS